MFFIATLIPYPLAFWAARGLKDSSRFPPIHHALHFYRVLGWSSTPSRSSSIFQRIMNHGVRGTKRQARTGSKHDIQYSALVSYHDTTRPPPSKQRQYRHISMTAIRAQSKCHKTPLYYRGKRSKAKHKYPYHHARPNTLQYPAKAPDKRTENTHATTRQPRNKAKKKTRTHTHIHTHTHENHNYCAKKQSHLAATDDCHSLPVEVEPHQAVQGKIGVLRPRGRAVHLAVQRHQKGHSVLRYGVRTAPSTVAQQHRGYTQGCRTTRLVWLGWRSRGWG